MIEVQNLTKVYKMNKKQMAQNKSKDKTKIAANKVSFTANKGEIFGLLGPNGAGKTTTLRCISTLIKPTEGSVMVNGKDNQKESMFARQNIAFLTNELKLDAHFTPEYTMEFFGNLYGLSNDVIKDRREELFRAFGIDEFRHVKIGEMSTGMKQKLSIAVSLVHDPDVVIFDEPTNGLDIITARQVTEYLKKLRDQGKAVIVSTHIMTVAEKLCDRIAIIIDGEIRAYGPIESIIKEQSSNDLEDAFFNIYSSIKGEV